MSVADILVIAMFASFILGIMSGYPIGWVLGGLGVLFTAVGYYSDLYLGTSTGLNYLVLGISINRIFSIMSNWELVSLPLFTFMGFALDKSGVAERMLYSIQTLFGRIHGGLAITVALIGIILAASTGVVGASVVLLGLLSLPIMLEQGYSKTVATGTIAASGTLGILIPPSIMLVIMGGQTSLPVGDLFMGALIPGVILGVLYIIYLLAYGIFSPESVPIPKEYKGINMAILWEAIKAIVPAIFLILSVLGSIFLGIATPTEASGLGAFGALLLALFYGRLDLKTMKQILLDTYKTLGYIFGIFIGATVFALVLRELGGDQLVEEMLHSLPGGPYSVIIYILAGVFLLGFFLDWIEITLVVLPLVVPVIEKFKIPINGFGVVDNPSILWFVILVAVALQTSFLTPPVGYSLFYLKGVSPPQVTLVDIYKGIVPFVLIQLFALAIIFFFPDLVTWLPAYAYGNRH